MNGRANETADESQNPRKRAKYERENFDVEGARSILNVKEIARLVCSYIFGRSHLYEREAHDVYKIVSLVSKTFNEASRFSFRKARLDITLFEAHPSFFKNLLNGFPNVTKIYCPWWVQKMFFTIGGRKQINEEDNKPSFEVLESVTSLNVCGKRYSNLLKPGILPNLRSLRMQFLSVPNIDFGSYPNLTKLSLFGVCVESQMKIPESLKSLVLVNCSTSDLFKTKNLWVRFTNDASPIEELTLSRSVCYTIMKESSPFSSTSFPGLKKLTIREDDGTGLSEAQVTLTRCSFPDVGDVIKFTVSVRIIFPMPLLQYFEKVCENAIQEENPVLPSRNYVIDLTASLDRDSQQGGGRTFEKLTKTWYILSENPLLSFLEIAFIIRDYFTPEAFNWNNWKNVMKILAWGEGIIDFPYVNTARPASDDSIKKFLEHHKPANIAL